MQYNSDIHYLGIICKKYGHEYETSDKGLRYLSSHDCVECTRLRRQSEKGRAIAKKCRDSRKEKANNSNRYYWGAICKYRHEFETSGKSLRYLNGGACVECIKIRNFSEEEKVYRKVYGKEYRQSEEGRAAAKRHRQSEKGRVAAKRHSQTEKGRATQKRCRQSEKRKEWNKKQIAEHTPHHIRQLIRVYVWSILKKYTETGKIMSCRKYGIDGYAICKHLGPHPNTLGIEGKFHIDHKYPLSLLNLNNPEHVKVAFDPLNHQWLTEEENLKKGNKIPDASEIPKALLRKLNSIGLEI